MGGGLILNTITLTYDPYGRWITLNTIILAKLQDNITNKKACLLWSIVTCSSLSASSSAGVRFGSGAGGEVAGAWVMLSAPPPPPGAGAAAAGERCGKYMIYEEMNMGTRACSTCLIALCLNDTCSQRKHPGTYLNTVYDISC